MINWQLSKQGICWPVSRDHIVGSGQEFMEVACSLKLTADQVLDFWLDHGFKPGYYSGREGGSTYKGKILHQLNPDTLLTFLPTYSLHNRLLESPWYIAYIISAILGTLIRYGLLKCN